MYLNAGLSTNGPVAADGTLGAEVFGGSCYHYTLVMTTSVETDDFLQESRSLERGGETGEIRDEWRDERGKKAGLKVCKSVTANVSGGSGKKSRALVGD